MDYKLLAIRIQSFVVEAGTVIGGLLLAALIEALQSNVFTQLVTDHWGTGLVASFILMFVSGGVKHLKNLKAIKKLGSADNDNVILI